MQMSDVPSNTEAPCICIGILAHSYVVCYKIMALRSGWPALGISVFAGNSPFPLILHVGMPYDIYA